MSGWLLETELFAGLVCAHAAVGASIVSTVRFTTHKLARARTGTVVGQGAITVKSLMKTLKQPLVLAAVGSIGGLTIVVSECMTRSSTPNNTAMLQSLNYGTNSVEAPALTRLD